MRDSHMGREFCKSMRENQKLFRKVMRIRQTCGGTGGAVDRSCVLHTQFVCKLLLPKVMLLGDRAI